MFVGLVVEPRRRCLEELPDTLRSSGAVGQSEDVRDLRANAIRQAGQLQQEGADRAERIVPEPLDRNKYRLGLNDGGDLSCEPGASCSCW